MKRTQVRIHRPQQRRRPMTLDLRMPSGRVLRR